MIDLLVRIAYSTRGDLSARRIAVHEAMAGCNQVRDPRATILITGCTTDDTRPHEHDERYNTVVYIGKQPYGTSVEHG
jgi:hypothetical protein